jgi:hypothetical protein
VLGLRVQRLRFRFGLGLRVKGLGFGFQGLIRARFYVLGAWLRFYSLESRVQG